MPARRAAEEVAYRRDGEPRLDPAARSPHPPPDMPVRPLHLRAPLARVAWLTLVAGVAVVAALLALASARPGSQDDAFVVLVQARELLHTGRFAYGPGGEVVDGFTSLLDLLWKALFLRIFPRDPVWTLWNVSTATYVAAVVALVLFVVGEVRAAPRRRGLVLAAVCSALALATAPGLAEGTSYLLETPLLALTTAWAAIAIPSAREGRPTPFRDVLAVAAGWALACTRPEALPVVALLFAARVTGAQGPARWRAAAAWAGGIAAFLGWRLATFGAWAPNAYYAKRSDSLALEVRDGVRYLLDGLAGATSQAASPAAATAALATVLGAALALAAPEASPDPSVGRPLARGARMFGVAAALAFALVVLSGGDAYSGTRLLVPGFLWAALATVRLALSGPRGWRSAAVGCLAVVCVARASEVLPGAGDKWRAITGATWGEDDFACARTVARELADALDGEPLAHRHFQAAKYFAPDLAVIDLTGLTDRDIAHGSAPGPVRFGRTSLAPALDRRAGAILLPHEIVGPRPLAVRALAETLSVRERAASLLGEPLPDGALLPRLLESYRPASLPDPCGVGTWLNVLVREDLAPRFVARGFTVFSK